MLGSWSGAGGGHVSGEDVVGAAVEVLAGSVLAHGGPRVSVAGGDLYVAQVYARVETGRERCSNRVEWGRRSVDRAGYWSGLVIAGAGYEHGGTEILRSVATGS
jgi:hypothetical protein